MRRILLLACLLVGVSLPAQAMERYWNYCQKGAFSVITQGLTSDSFYQRTFRSCTIEVFVAGTLVHPANIYSDNNSPGVPTPLANPFTSNADGFFMFYAASGRYDVRITAAAGERNLSPVPYSYTWGDILLCDPLGPNADANCGAGGGGGISGVNWYHNGVLVGIEPGADFIDALSSGVNVTINPFTDDGPNARVHLTFNSVQQYQNNGAPVGAEPIHNLIAGTNITLSPFVDSPGTTSVNTTFNSVQQYQSSGVPVAAEPALNVIPGTGVTTTMVDNPGSTRVDLTINSSSGACGVADNCEVVGAIRGSWREARSW